MNGWQEREMGEGTRVEVFEEGRRIRRYGIEGVGDAGKSRGWRRMKI